MTQRIKLSLAGDGRLVILSPQTVRKAFFLFSNANPQYTSREKYRLDYPVYNADKIGNIETITWPFHYYGKATINDALHRGRYLNGSKINHYDNPDLLYLHPQDIKKVERQINKYIIDYDCALVEDEGRLLMGYDLCDDVGKNRQKIKYIRRYGMYFVVEPISRDAVIKKRNIDLFIQSADTWDFHLVRYQGILLSSLKTKIKLLFSHRLDFSKTWTWTREQFKPRQILRIIKVYPCPDFSIVRM